MNLRMHEKVNSGDAINVSGCSRTPECDYILRYFDEDLDYCDLVLERWIWSIGKNRVTGQVLASQTSKFYGNDEYECLWLR